MIILKDHFKGVEMPETQRLRIECYFTFFSSVSQVARKNIKANFVSRKSS
jgi:hypothetical protein